MVITIVVLVILVLGLLYLDRAILLDDAKKLEAEVIAEIEKVVAGAEASVKAKVASELDKLKAKL